MATPKTGPLTIQDLQAIWESACDPSYAQSFIQAGEGNGFEAHTQSFAQAARVSEAIDTTTQALYILPWSGQSGSPASGAKLATVALTLARTGLTQIPLVVPAGEFVDEQQDDWGTSGSVPTLTGRRYSINAFVVFEPGQTGPMPAAATAERPGYGYNNPLPGSLQLLEQVGTLYSNSGASVRGVGYPAVPSSALSGPAGAFLQHVFLDAADEPDAFLPDHVGQYLQFTAGANAGSIARIVAYQPPNLAAVPPTGGTVELALDQSLSSAAGHYTGTFSPGELLTLKSGGSVTGYGRLLDAQLLGSTLHLTFQRLVGSAVTTVVGQTSGASATVDHVDLQADFTQEAGTATWRILDWAADWGLTVINAARPSGGTSPMLDAIGKERNIPRAANEADASYRQRVAQVADTVSPNAIRRTLNRMLGNLPWCFREAGAANYPGFFYDHDFYDLDAQLVGGPVVGGQFFDGEIVEQQNASTQGGNITARARITWGPPASVPGPPVGSTLSFAGFSQLVPSAIPGFVPAGPNLVGKTSGAILLIAGVTGGLRPQDRYRVYFDYLSMRAWFYIGLPLERLGDSGFAYDTHPTGAYDCTAPFLDFYDGAPWQDAWQALAVWAAIDRARAGGVGVTFYPEVGTCP